MRVNQSSGGIRRDPKPSIASPENGETERLREPPRFNPQELSIKVSLSSNTSSKTDVDRHLNQSSRELSLLKSKFYDILISIDEQNQSARITAGEIKEWIKTLEVVEEQIKEIRNKTE
jgi:hypothetical protein